MRRTTLLLPAAGLGALLALAAPLAASAHIHVTPDATPAGSSTVLDFAVGHGCDDSPTTALTITVPEGLDVVQPVVDADWAITTASEAAADGTERVSSVTFTAVQPLPVEYFDTVSLNVRPSEDAVGKTLAFPVLQTCETGQTDWADDPADDSVNSSPAPAITVTAAADGGPHGAGGTDAQEAGAAAAPVDVAARVLGIAGLVVGAVGLVAAFAARRRPVGKRAAADGSDR